MPTVTVNIPSQVLTYANLAAFPVSGELLTIYIAIDTNLEYRWTGSAYQVLGSAGSVTVNNIGAAINGANSATPNDTDLVMSVESSVAKKNTWTQIKAFLKTYYDTIYTTTSAVATQITTAISGKEDTSNKSSSYTLSSTTTYANTKALVDGLATKEPLKGSDDNYVTDAQLVVIGNTSGTNTGDQTRASLGIDAGTIIVTSGTSFTTPSNITTSTIFYIHLIGAGGGGASTNTTNSTPGGGGGGYCFVKVTGLSPSTTYTCAIGAGGAGGAAGASNNGSNGGNTTLTIGGTTYTANGGTGATASVSTDGGAGGTASNGDLNVTGQAGGDSPASNAAVIAGEGGDSPLGWGFGGKETRSGKTGNAGAGYGGGGAGGKNAAGGAGSNGIIYCEYFN